VAATVAARRLTEMHRVAQARIAAQSVVQLRRVWPLLDPDDLDESFDRWIAAAAPIVGTNRRASAELAANYVRTFKRLELGARAVAPVVLAAVAPSAAVTTSLLVTGPVAVKQALARGVSIDRAMRTAEARSAAAAMRHALNGGRDTITATISEDRDALGWARVTSGRPCAFCAMLSSRGPVYKGEDTAGFQPHDNCHCVPEPVYRQDAAWPPGAERFRALWDQAKSADGDTGSVFRRLVESGEF